MHSISEDMKEFQRQLEKGAIQKAYGAVLSYMMGLRTHFKNNHAGSTVSGLYQGYMDMTYFALFPASLKQLKYNRSLRKPMVLQDIADRGWISSIA